MLYEWINSNTVNKPGSNAQLDGNDKKGASVSEMLYYKCSRRRMERRWLVPRSMVPRDVGTDSDTDWYYVDDGKIKHAEVADDYVTDDDDGPVYGKNQS